MAEPENRDTGRISVSKDFLSNALTQLELRLVEKLVTKGEHEALSRRVSRLEEKVARMVGGLLLCAVVVGALATYLAAHG